MRQKNIGRNKTTKSLKFLKNKSSKKINKPPRYIIVKLLNFIKKTNKPQKP